MARKARGLTFGNPENLTAEARQAGSAVTRARAVADLRTVAASATALRGQGQSLRAVAAGLELHGFTTRRGGPWSDLQVKRVLVRQFQPQGEPGA